MYMSNFLDYYLDQIKNNPEYCIGIYLNDDFISNFNLILSQISKTKLELNPSFFYLRSDSNFLSKKIKEIYYNEILTSDNFGEDISHLIKFFISPSTNLLPKDLLGKEMILCSESSLYFNFNKDHISRFI